MRTFAITTLLASLLVTPALEARAEHPDAIAVTGAWTRATPPGAPTAVGYLTVTNHGREADRLTSADSPAAMKLSIHQMSMAGGIMRMRPVTGGLEIAPGGSVSLGPDSDHLMFEGLKRPFKTGEQIPVALHFQYAGTVTTVLQVR